MTRYGILALVVLALGISTNAQSSSSNQANASAQAQTNASASASASRPENQGTPANKQDSKTSHSKTASASGNTSNSASASANGNSLDIASGTPIQAELVTPVDAKHNKPGDPVVAKTTQDVKENGQTLLKKGSRLTGHVTQTEARSKANSESSVGMVFDNAVMKNGQKVPMNLSVQALAAAANQTSAAFADDQGAIGSTSQTGAGIAGTGSAPGGGGVRGAGGAVGGVGGTVRGVSNAASGAASSVGTGGGLAGNVGQTAGGTLGATTRSAGSVGGLNSTGQLTSNSSGVFNLQGLNLASAASNGTTASVVNSTSRNVHLDSGTQMVLQVLNQ